MKDTLCYSHADRRPKHLPDIWLNSNECSGNAKPGDDSNTDRHKLHNGRTQACKAKRAAKNNAKAQNMRCACEARRTAKKHGM